MLLKKELLKDDLELERQLKLDILNLAILGSLLTDKESILIARARIQSVLVLGNILLPKIFNKTWYNRKGFEGQRLSGNIYEFITDVVIESQKKVSLDHSFLIQNSEISRQLLLFKFV